jgi:glucose/arabinose dehydrogenase
MGWSRQRLSRVGGMIFLVVLGALVFLGPGPAADPAAVPAGFTDTLVAGVAKPQGLDFTPDGRLLVSTQEGYVRVIANGTLLPTPALNLGPILCNDKEGGVPGIAVDPNFAANHYIYLYYTFNKSGTCAYGTSNSPVNRVSRFVLPDSNVIDPASELVLLDNMPSIQGQHTGGDLKFGKDGDLYVSVGDGACDFTGVSGCFAANNAARYQNALVGKVLRITPTGGIPADNPFTGPDSGRCGATGTTTAAKCQETYLWGFRNPFRMAVDPNASGTRLYVNDTGDTTWEEIDLAQAGADYGWNVREGFCATASTTDCGPPPAGMTNPIFAYGHNIGCGGTGAAITAAAFVPVGVWPSSFDDAYLFGDFDCGTIFQLVRSGGGFTMQNFATGLGNVISMAFGPAGVGKSLTYLTYANGGQVRRIDYVGAGSGTSATFIVGASGDDGDVHSRSAAYPPSGTPVANTNGSFVTAGRRFVFGGYDGFTGLLRFDTSSLPDNAVVTSATLRVYVTAKADDDNRRLVAEWYPSSNWPIDSSDYSLSSTGSALPGADITQISTGTTNDFPLTGSGSVSTTGFTGLRLGIDGGQPNGDNYVQIASSDNAALPKPQLLVTYAIPPSNTGLPTVSGSAAVGQTLTASPGTWAGTAPISYAYLWQRCTNTCTPIATATNSQYTVTSADAGFQLQVAVTATNGGGSSSATSANTATVPVPGATMTFSVTVSGDDGDLNARGSTYPPAGTPAPYTAGVFITAGRRFAFGSYENLVTLARFDTSALPDNATVTSARLRVYVTAKSDADNRNLIGDWYPPSHWPIDANDYTLNAQGGAFTADITALPTGGLADIPLTTTTGISTTGLSALRLLVDGGQPAGDNYVQMASWDNTTYPEPQLVVTYTTP